MNILGRKFSGPLGRALVALCLAASVGSSARAQVYSWNDISGSLGFSEIYELSTGTFMARYDDLVVKSTDGSLTWQDFPRPGGPIFEFTARGEMAVLKLFFSDVLLSSQYWKSTNDGATWRRFSAERSNQDHFSLIIDAGGEVHGLFLRSNRITVEKFSRQDSVWRQIGNLSTAQYIYNNPWFTVAGIDEGYNFYIGTGTDGIHTSRDGGVTWTEALAYRYISAITTDPGGPVAIGTLPNGRTAGGVFVTPDSGITWNFLGLIDVEITSLGYDDAGRLFAVTSDGIYRHIGADDWELTGPERDTYSYFMKTSTGRLMVSAQDAGIGRSTDSGETWFSDAIRGREVYAVGSTADGSLLAGTFGGGMFKSGNDGETWRPVGTEIRSRVIHELDAVGAAMIASTADGLYRSDDNGESWSDVSAGQPFDAVTSFAIDGAGAWYAGTPAGIYRSTDGAASWTLAGLGGEPVGEIITAPDGSVYALSASTGVYRSAAGGTSWNWLNLSGGDLRTIAVSEAGFVYVGGWGVVWRSTDGGANWSGIGVGFSYVESLIFNGQHHIVAGTTNGAFVSFTGGDFWDFAGLGGGSVTAFAFDRSHALIAGVYGGGVFRTAHVITGVRDEAGLPSEFLLHDNFPNPFNPSTTIRFDLPSAARVNVSVFDALGREVAPLVAAELPAGAHETSWDASDRPSGVYFVRMRYESAGSRSGVPASGDLVRKILLVR